MDKKCTLCHLTKPLEAFYKKPGRLSHDCRCRACQNKGRAKRYQKRNKDAVRASNRARYLIKREEPGYLEAKAAYAREWRKTNHHITRKNRADRRARLAKATPAWANQEAIDKIYALAAHQKSLTGDNVHVDHIVPLTSHLVCGLHTEQNLRIVVGEFNSYKSNRDWPGK
jgi:hypothetical protein